MPKPRGRGRDKGKVRKKDGLRKNVKKRVNKFGGFKVKDIDYKDVTMVRRLINEKNKIMPLRTSGATPGLQRAIATAVKRAREMALIPYCTSR